jgi:hypothetical protein
MDLLLPDVRITKAYPKLIDNTARFQSIFTGVTRTVARPGERWGFRLEYDNLQQLDRARIETFIASLRGGANRALVSPPDYPRRGNFPAVELFPNGDFSIATNYWTATGATFTVADRQGRVQNAGAATGRITNAAAIPLTSGAGYVARVVAAPGNQVAYKIQGGTTPGALDVFSDAPATIGYTRYPFTAPGANFYLSLFCNTIVAADFINYALASVARCPLVNGANQSGAALIVDALPPSANNLLLPGDWIGINMELKRVSAPLNSDSSGNGVLQFTPPLRASPANNDPIVINAPMGRFIMSTNETPWESDPGIVSTYTLDMVEAP